MTPTRVVRAWLTSPPPPSYLLSLPPTGRMAGRVLLEGVDDDLETSRPLRLVPSYPPAVAPPR